MFAWVFVISIERAVSARSAELSLETGDARAVSGRGLELTPALGTLPDATPVPVRPRQPAPWWPALLFGLAFVSGWAFRHALRDTLAATSALAAGDEQAPKPASAEPASAEPDEPVLPLEVVITPPGRASHRPPPDSPHDKKDGPATITRVKPVRLATAPDLTTDFPWDASAASGLAGLSESERMAQLEKQNASKAEIIKALEKLVVENREKWLHQDETEARLNRHIEELSRDLQVAIRQLQELQSDVPSRSGRRHKKTG